MHMPRKMTPEELAVAPRVWRKNGAGVLVKGVDPDWYRALVANEDTPPDTRATAEPEAVAPPPAPTIAPDLVAEYRRPVGPAARIVARVADAHGVTVDQIVGESRIYKIVAARQHAAYELFRMGKTLLEAGRILGGRDHTTILHAARVWPEKARKLGIPANLEGEP